MRIQNPRPDSNLNANDGGRMRGNTLLLGSPRPLSWRKGRSARALTQSRTCWTHLAFCLLVFFLSLPATAQYAITWHTIDGGGGTSTGGVYSVTGTIGQPDAGATMTGGSYSLTGGFWALPEAVPNPNAPTLTIVPAGPGQARISWAPNTPGFVLQERASLSTGSWTDSPSGTNNPALVPATLPARFYRLSKP